MTSAIPPVCLKCTWYNPKTFYPRCSAFKDKNIPDNIFYGGAPHNKPIPGDHGIQFKAIKEEPDK